MRDEAPQVMRLVERDGFLAAELEGDDGPPLTVEEVRATLERVRP